MLRRVFPFVSFLVLGTTMLLTAQEPAYREDLRFVDALRKRKDNKLALEYLERIAKGAPPALARELPLELAKTRLEAAGEEPDSDSRLKLFKTAREELEKFIKDNPGHARLADANLDIARVLNFQGKAELSRAKLSDDAKTRDAGLKAARATLAEANKQLRAAVEALEIRFAKLPEPPPKEKSPRLAERQRLSELIRETKLEIALNLYSQWQTGLDEKLGPTMTALKNLDGSENSPVTWKAMAWLGRCQVVAETTPDPARLTYRRILDAKAPAAFEGKRIARYHYMLLTDESPPEALKKTKNEALIKEGLDWRKSYPKDLRTPEGFGVSYLMAKLYIAQANNPKYKAQRQQFFVNARNLLREIESAENDFSMEARLLKFAVLKETGVLKKAIGKLKTAEECFIRADYEISEIHKAHKKAKGPEAVKKLRDKHIEAAIAALSQGLKRPDVGKQPRQQVQKARVTLTYWYLLGGKLREAIAEGESFARSDPGSPQAALAACYALDAHGRLLAQRKAEFASAEELAEDRAGMFRWGRYMEERWPREHAGDMARHEIGLLLFRDENDAEAIKKLSTITPEYANLTRARFLLSSACFRAIKGKVEPITGDRAGDYRRRAIAALESLPASALGTDPDTNFFYLSGKSTLIGEWYHFARYKDMEALANSLLKTLKGNKVRLSFNAEDDRAKRAALRNELVSMKLYASYGQANAAFAAEDYAEVVKILDPLVAEVRKTEDTPEKVALKNNQFLATPMLSLSLKANIQLGKIKKTDEALDALDAVTGEGGNNSVLQLLATLIRIQVAELRKSGDAVTLKKAIKGYTGILDKRIAKQKKLTPDFLLVLADCYTSMGEHGKAAGELAKVVIGKDTPDAERLSKVVPLKLVRELRLSKVKKNLKKAAREMEKIMGPPGGKPGWGRRNLEALREYGYLLEAQTKYSDAIVVWAPLVKQLAPKAQTDPRLKEIFLECYYHLVLSYYRHGLTLSTKDARDKSLALAAGRIVEFEKAWGADFGGDVSKQRFDELFTEAPALRKAYLAARKGS
jgi:hypothetical protein